MIFHGASGWRNRTDRHQVDSGIERSQRARAACHWPGSALNGAFMMIMSLFKRQRTRMIAGASPGAALRGGYHRCQARFKFKLALTMPLSSRKNVPEVGYGRLRSTWWSLIRGMLRRDYSFLPMVLRRVLGLETATVFLGGDPSVLFSEGSAIPNLVWQGGKELTLTALPRTHLWCFPNRRMSLFVARAWQLLHCWTGKDPAVGRARDQHPIIRWHQHAACHAG